jgi:hypothetical protein
LFEQLHLEFYILVTTSSDGLTGKTSTMANDNTKHADTSQAMVGEKEPIATAIETSIHPENEVVGLRLLLIHVGITLAAFLAGLVDMLW